MRWQQSGETNDFVSPVMFRDREERCYRTKRIEWRWGAVPFTFAL